MGTACQVWFNLPEIFLPFPSNLDWDKIKQLQIVPRAGYFDAVWISESQSVKAVNLDPRKALSIDPGLDNWLTCTTTEGPSFIIDGKHLKSLNQWYNKQVATIKENKPQGFWCKQMESLWKARETRFVSIC